MYHSLSHTHTLTDTLTDTHGDNNYVLNGCVCVYFGVSTRAADATMTVALRFGRAHVAVECPAELNVAMQHIASAGRRPDQQSDMGV